MEFIVKVLLYDFDSKFFLLFFAFYFLLFRITFYFFLYLCPIPIFYSDQQSTAFATIVSEALFCLCRGTIFITLLGCARISGHVPRLFILFIFSYFSLWILYIAGARETQEDILWVFISKTESRQECPSFEGNRLLVLILLTAVTLTLTL